MKLLTREEAPIGGRDPSESPAGFDRNAWPPSLGIHGRLRRNAQPLLCYLIRVSAEAAHFTAFPIAVLRDNFRSCLRVLGDCTAPGMTSPRFLVAWELDDLVVVVFRALIADQEPPNFSSVQ